MDRMFVKGVALESLIAERGFIELFRDESSGVLLSIIDSYFDPTSSFIFGTPSIHCYVRSSKDGFVAFAYLDLKSTTFSFNASETEHPIGPYLMRAFSDYIWGDLSVYRYEAFTLDEIIDDLHFFAGLNTYIFGFAASSESQFNELEQRVIGLNTVFEIEETKRIAYGMSLMNLIARESVEYKDQTSHYLVPTVGVEGLELWLGTNSTFYVHLAETCGKHDINNPSESEENKNLLKFLFNIVFLRFCLYLSKSFQIQHYTVSKIEKAFILEGKDKETVRDLLACIRVINKNAAAFFLRELLPVCDQFSVILSASLKKYQQISTFYDESNFVYMTILALTDDTSEYQSLFESLFHQNINKLIESLLDIVRQVDRAIARYVEEGKTKC
ncbi:MAG TPA: hypothetical protein PKM99_05660 [Thermotogota bacterium]|nr:hypothetical protein [Thermotogota bacterium]HNR63784.1 hypothetical protein [Thermotogota bacterium]HNT95585.1 hypothetical protein [Thermotogota bacterium]HOZ11913.1 hypothetical protein [Thermotogota bacterium]HPB86931.1 hypothetical protein [Thermotogota bacterium]